MRQNPIVITTWPEKSNDKFKALLKSHGIQVLSMPMIVIYLCPVKLPRALSNYHWLVFTSKNGVHSFFKQQQPHNHNKIAVIGKGTARALEQYNIKPDFIGSGLSGTHFAEELVSVIGSQKNILLALGNLAPDTLNDRLGKANQVDRTDVYKTCKPSDADPEILSLIEADEYDLIAVSSPSVVKNLYDFVASNHKTPLRLISIGETTTMAARDLGINPLETSENQSYGDFANCVMEYFKIKRPTKI